MALSYKNTRKAIEILEQIQGHGMAGYDFEGNELKTGVLLLGERKADDGREGVVINVRNITSEQSEIFELRKREIPNSIIFRVLDEDPELTKVGWF